MENKNVQFGLNYPSTLLSSMKGLLSLRRYDEPATVALMHEYMESQGYALDITDKRLYHEIYLSDARKVAPDKLKTVIRHPIRKK